jgi:hypothetical protein
VSALPFTSQGMNYLTSMDPRLLIYKIRLMMIIIIILRALMIAGIRSLILAGILNEIVYINNI